MDPYFYLTRGESPEKNAGLSIAAAVYKEEKKESTNSSCRNLKEMQSVDS